LVLSEAVHDRHVLALDVAGIFEALAKSAQPVRKRVRQWRSQKPDRRHRRLLRARRERPRRRAAEQREKLAPPDHSITSSARASKVSGMFKPSALALLRLSTVSYFTGACTGRSLGFSPLRMRST